MPRPSSRPPTTTGPRTIWLSLVLAACLPAACKKNAPTQAPMDAQLVDDIAQIEAELEANADHLEAQGIYVARAQPPAGDGYDYAEPESESDSESEAAGEEDEAEAPSTAPSSDPSPTLATSQDRDVVSRASRRSDRNEKEVTKQKRAPSSREGFWSRWLSKRERKKDEAEQCQRVCDLAEATCGLADRICDLAERHPDEGRYQRACGRAEDQCRVASEACTACAK